MTHDVIESTMWASKIPVTHTVQMRDTNQKEFKGNTVNPNGASECIPSHSSQQTSTTSAGVHPAVRCEDCLEHAQLATCHSPSAQLVQLRERLRCESGTLLV